MSLQHHVNEWKKCLEGEAKGDDAMSASEIIERNFGIDLIRSHDSEQFFGAQITVTTGGPHIVIDTLHELIIARHGGENIAVYYNDRIGLSDTVKEMFE